MLKRASEDLPSRRKAWQILSMLFLDNESTPTFLRLVVKSLSELGYTLSELERILYEEVYPTCIPNLLSFVGEWEAFNVEWIESKVLKREKKGRSTRWWLWPFRWMIAKRWEHMKSVLALPHKGNSYTNITMKNVEHQPVIAAMRELGRTAFVSSVVNDIVLVYDSETENNPATLPELARELSQRLRSPAISVLVLNDDLLVYHLFVEGDLVDTRRFQPECSRTELLATAKNSAEKLAAAFGRVESTTEIEGPLQADCRYASDRHYGICDALGIPTTPGMFGYAYIKAGEASEYQHLVHVGS